jgi:predicted transcriptional regulator of viral defense system
VSREQLPALGVDGKRIERWLADGRLRRVHRSVYAVGHDAPSVLGEYIAAVLACGEGAVLSHRAAAYKLALLRGAPPPPEVTVPTTAHRGRPGVVVHRVKALHVFDASTLDGIAITTVPRTLLDLAPTTTLTQLTRLCHVAWVRHDCGPDKTEACIARNPRKPGAASCAERSDRTSR